MCNETSQAIAPDEATKTETPSTLFPKIDGKAKGFIYELERRVPAETHSLSLEGTIKLHGTHADILYDLSQADIELARNVSSSGRTESVTEANPTAAGIRIQSRNLELGPGKENCGFPTVLLQHCTHLHSLKALILRRFCSMYAGVAISLDSPLVVAGEWIGSGVQKGVAINQLTKRFVMLSIALNGKWLDDALFADIEIPEAGIYNVRRAGTFTVKLNPKDRPMSEEDGVFGEMQELAEKVMLRCPFAATFDIEGKGEGIVWKIDDDMWRGEPALWFKTKGDGFEKRTAKERMSAGEHSKFEDGKKAEKMRARELAEAWVTERRVEQGFEFLAEKGIKTAGKGDAKAFIEWVREDVLVEERIEIKEAGIAEQSLKSEISSLAARRFMEVLKVRKKGEGVDA